MRNIQLVLYLLLISFIFAGCFSLIVPPVQAIVDPLASPNNRFGIHIISATINEASETASLVNSNGGDWGYITVLVESSNRQHDQWQAFFDDLRRRHLIPIVRLATQPDGSKWKIPYKEEEEAWADFLDNLIWPTKNRYVIIYNEPNQGQEWAGKVDPGSYAHVLDKTITALKFRSSDFFVLNAGFDASAPDKPPFFLEEKNFLRQMDQTVPGIFSKLDGWVSHSYPNPGYSGSADDTGKGTIRTWQWEESVLKQIGLTKSLPVFITETGWKHAEGLNFDRNLPSADTTANYYRQAFLGAWNNSQIVAVTPFLLNYQEDPFDHFSFKKINTQDFYPAYQTLRDLPKRKGQPKQEYKALLTKGTIYPSLVYKENYQILFSFKNIGQAIWNDGEKVQLRNLAPNMSLQISILPQKQQVFIEPDQEFNFIINVLAQKPGTYPVSLQFFHNEQPFDSPPLNFTTEVKSPVILKVEASLNYKNNPAGNYMLEISSDLGRSLLAVDLLQTGQSDIYEARSLLPDYSYTFTLSKPFYKAKSIKLSTVSGLNYLVFGPLQPDYLSAILHPTELWKLLPFNN